jgi:replicative DNA helicase
LSPLPEGYGLPASLHTEVAVLGAILLEATAIPVALERLTSDEFSLDSHQRIFSAIAAMYEKEQGVDYITVANHLKTKAELDAVGGIAYLLFLTEGIPFELNIEEYCDIIHSKALQRRALLATERALTRLASETEDVREVLADTEAIITELSESATPSGLMKANEIMLHRFDSIDQFFGMGEKKVGMSLSIPFATRLLGGGWKRKLLYIIAARPSMGKTAWMIQECVHAATHHSFLVGELLQGAVVAIFSLEMGSDEVLRRMACSLAGVTYEESENGELPANKRDDVLDWIDRLHHANLYIDDTPAITLAEIRAKCQRLIRVHGRLDLMAIDYLQLMGTTARKGDNRNEEVSALSRGLKALAKKLDCPVVALSQLSRDVEKRGGDKRPQLSDLRDSGAIEQDADVVALMYREDYYDKENEDVRGRAEIIVAKQRNGGLGTIHTVFKAQRGIFMERVIRDSEGYHG